MTVTINPAPRVTASRVASHYRQLIEDGIPEKLAAKLTNRYHWHVTEAAFKDRDDAPANPIGFTEAYSPGFVEQEDVYYDDCN